MGNLGVSLYIADTIMKGTLKHWAAIANNNPPLLHSAPPFFIMA